MLRDCCGVFLYVWWRTRDAMSSRHEGMRKVGGHYKKARWCFQGVQGMTGVYLLNPLAKERKAYGNMATFSSHQRWKIFQQRWKLDGRKKCHYWILTSVNILSVAFFYQMEQTDSEYLWPCSSWEGDVCLMSLWISCSRRCSSPGSTAMIQQSAVLQALCWKSSLVNGKFSSGVWLQTQITLVCPQNLQGTLFSEAFCPSLFAQVALPAHTALSTAAPLPLQPGRSGGSGTEPTQ